ncbi:hypothetical protein Msi02_84060 [Microbispora siamensis]|uniref:DUF397 domain-containing protein n=1 Tax=Microbispora siamensis TaxID=564413 RepID=A0ABQ4H240_9ACTN|nr:hypothetical protein Msi02_84060 [Microbispora siamensis]
MTDLCHRERRHNESGSILRQKPDTAGVILVRPVECRDEGSRVAEDHAVIAPSDSSW